MMLAAPVLAKSLAGICAISCAALTNAVGRFAPFQRTVEPATKPAPLTVKLNAALCANAAFGVSELRLGAGLLMVKLKAFDAPPPPLVLAGLKTVTLAAPALAMSLAGIVAVNCALLLKVVARSAPFQRTTAPLTKLAPLTVSVKLPPPAVAWLGLSAARLGVGLGCGLIVKVNAFDVPPPPLTFAGLKTVTLAAPTLAKSLAGRAAVNCVALTNVVARSAPFQRTTAPLTKLEPLTVNVNALLPAIVAFGFKLVIDGTGLGG